MKRVEKKKWSKPVLQKLKFRKTQGGWAPDTFEDVTYNNS